MDFPEKFPVSRESFVGTKDLKNSRNVAYDCHERQWEFLVHICKKFDALPCTEIKTKVEAIENRPPPESGLSIMVKKSFEKPLIAIGLALSPGVSVGLARGIIALSDIKIWNKIGG